MASRRWRLRKSTSTRPTRARINRIRGNSKINPKSNSRRRQKLTNWVRLSMEYRNSLSYRKEKEMISGHTSLRKKMSPRIKATVPRGTK
jgi:hypothetical protein